MAPTVYCALYVCVTIALVVVLRSTAQKLYIFLVLTNGFRDIIFVQKLNKF